jgi:hypothetical protein
VKARGRESLMKYIVYLTINIVNRKIYIGVHKTHDPKKFDGYIGNGIWSGNERLVRESPFPFHAAVRKYGYTAFERLTLGVYDTVEEAYMEESRLVTREFLERDDVYNAKRGGIGGSPSTKILQYTQDGKFVKEWSSISGVYEVYGKKYNARITKCLTGEDKHYMGFQWKYYTEDYPLVIEGVDGLLVHVVQYDISGNLIKIHDSLSNAAIEVEGTYSGLRHSTQSRKLYAGYQWRIPLGKPIEKILEYVDPDVVLQIDPVTKELVKEWAQVVEALRAGFQITKQLNPYNGRAKKFTWIYKTDYIHSRL